MATLDAIQLLLQVKNMKNMHMAKKNESKPFWLPDDFDSIEDFGEWLSDYFVEQEDELMEYQDEIRLKTKKMIKPLASGVDASDLIKDHDAIMKKIEDLYDSFNPINKFTIVKKALNGDVFGTLIVGKELEPIDEVEGNVAEFFYPENRSPSGLILVSREEISLFKDGAVHYGPEFRKIIFEPRFIDAMAKILDEVEYLEPDKKGHVIFQWNEYVGVKVFLDTFLLPTKINLNNPNSGWLEGRGRVEKRALLIEIDDWCVERMLDIVKFTAVWRKNYKFTIQDVIESMQDPDLEQIVSKDYRQLDFLKELRELNTLTPYEFERVFIESMKRLIEMKKYVVEREDGKFAWIGS